MMEVNGFEGATTVLVVEDEALIRTLLVDDLEEAGYEVVEAASGDAAVALLSDGRDFDAVVTDVRMPGRLDGLALAAWLNHHRPAVPVIVTSGYVNEAEVRAINPAITAVLPKPYDIADIVALVAATRRSATEEDGDDLPR